MVKANIKFICTQKSQSGKNQGRWSSEEQDRFLKGCYLYKNNWKKIQEYIRTRTIPQIRSHAQKYLIRLCGKYSVKLSKKKFALSNSNQDIATVSYKKRLNISKMNIYERNIFEMFNYYNREIINEDTENQGQKSNINKNNDNLSLNHSLDFTKNHFNINPEINLNEKLSNNKDRLMKDVINLLKLNQKIELETYKVNNSFIFDDNNLNNNYDIFAKKNLELFNNNLFNNNFYNLDYKPKVYTNEITYNNYNYNNYIDFYNRNINNNITNNLLINNSIDFKNINNYNKINENFNHIYNNSCIQNQPNIILLPTSKIPLEVNNCSKMQNCLNGNNNNESRLYSIRSNHNYQNYNNDISFYDYANNYSNYAANQIFNYTFQFFNKLKEQSIIQLNELENLKNKFINKK